MAKKEQAKPNALVPALSAQADIATQQEAVNPNLLMAAMADTIEARVGGARRNALNMKTPAEVIEKVPGGETRDGKSLEFDYIKLGYLLNKLQEDYEFIEFEMIEPPHMVTITQAGTVYTPPFVVCTMALSVYKAGMRVKRVVAEGYRDIPVAKDKKWYGFRASFVGCVTEGMRKLISLLGYGNDVYDYGLEDAVDVKIDWTIDSLKEEYPAVLTAEREQNIRDYLRRAAVPMGKDSAADNFKKAVDTVYQTLKKAEVIR